MTASTAPKKITSGDQKKLYTSSKLFVRLPLDHEWRNLSPAGLKEVIVKHQAVSPASIGLIKPVRTGFAISPCSIAVRGALLRTNTCTPDAGSSSSAYSTEFQSYNKRSNGSLQRNAHLDIDSGMKYCTMCKKIALQLYSPVTSKIRRIQHVVIAVLWNAYDESSISFQQEQLN
ncbi:hypothetical protein EPUL_000746 [Erysiphe pulchra]|uniref:Uncharacterized protein n=1 Tax=Erysiphe pulchra TaxID=225359 RepID=A0A2S4Q0M8_9PEZI|nr:hypothetical protein EPUL_000746 [Erysiphe pulchra]